MGEGDLNLGFFHLKHQEAFTELQDFGYFTI